MVYHIVYLVLVQSFSEQQVHTKKHSTLNPLSTMQTPLGVCTNHIGIDCTSQVMEHNANTTWSVHNSYRACTIQFM